MPETPEPVDTVDTGKPPAAVVPTQAAAPALALVPTAQLSSSQRSEQMDAVVQQIVRLNACLDALKVEYSRELDYYTTESDRCMLQGLNGRIDGTNAETGRHFRQVERDVAGCIARLNDAEQTVSSLAHACILNTPPNGSLWTRLRWLVFGR